MRRILFAFIFLALVWGAGLLAFISDLPAPASERPAPADGVVVFTGGLDRVSSAMSLLNDGAGKRLLISGVNPSVSRPDVAEMWPGDPAVFDCCVDLGVEARTTQGNADELDAWTRMHGYQSLILVTSEFHMPRALLETRERLPDVIVTPYPVASGLLGPDGKPQRFSDWRRIGGEYTKYLAVRAKSMLT
ncbi:MAG: YdcF family protein [Parvularculaceae bacterium]|nr:YdcF family protein [Parvularculaceae bacterium]